MLKEQRSFRLGLLVLATFCLASMSYSSATPPAAKGRPGPKAAVVKVLKEQMPSEEERRRAFLWHSFANKPHEQQFNSYTTERWKEHYKAFAAELKKKASKKKLNAASLGKALELILKDSRDKLAYLPVGAYQTKLDGKPVWIVTVNWEVVDPNEHLVLCHIRAFAYDQATLKQVAFMTCS